jgi:hypothetical protein
MAVPEVPPSVAVLRFAEVEAACAFRELVQAFIANNKDGPLRAIGTDMPLSLGDYSHPAAVDAGQFATRADVHRRIGANALPSDLTGDGVHVIVVDSGLDSSLIPGSQWGGGWQLLPGGPLPGTTRGKAALHGMMIVRNILAVAPYARIYDVPIIVPPRINDIMSFLSGAQAVFEHIHCTIKAMPGPPRQWILVNSWAIFDRRSEFPFREYTENQPTGGPPHPFIARIGKLAADNVDIVFCAGNCGGICPDGRCGPNDFGPGRSIWGANAHPGVLTVGAVRMDDSWIGYSSEGPGPAATLEKYKPDLCTPSEFLETAGQHPQNRGTSAAAGLAAGVVAALRTRWTQGAVPPATLFGTLRATARPMGGPGWNPRTGHGLLDAAAAANALP